MDPLDLTKRPPRSPKEQLDGLALLPRTIDKLRAKLPGGNIGAYKIQGMSSALLDFLGVTEEDLQGAVARAKSDEDVVAWLRDRVNTGRYPEITKKLSERNIEHVQDRDDLERRYPILKRRPDIYYLMDMLEADDEELFGTSRSS
ncbi:MAG: DUF5069 domain-containing protein [Candidatus Eremiobacteraeota bacterium]|nr:DUF5069 domain-containing protein [Candidatus Eremiobacteraeota bacterium]